MPPGRKQNSAYVLLYVLVALSVGSESFARRTLRRFAQRGRHHHRERLAVRPFAFGAILVGKRAGEQGVARQNGLNLFFFFSGVFFFFIFFPSEGPFLIFFYWLLKQILVNECSFSAVYPSIGMRDPGRWVICQRPDGFLGTQRSMGGRSIGGSNTC